MGVAVECLEWLLAQPQFQVLGVVCSPDPPSAWRVAAGDRNMADEAPKLGVPIYALEDAPAADLGLSVRFHEIFRRRHLERYGLGVVNLHGAPLPEMRGSMCEYIALHEGHSHYGASLHWMDEGVDTGDLLVCERFPIARHDTSMTLLQKANATGLQMIKATLAQVAVGQIAGIPQGEGRRFTRAGAMKYLQHRRAA